MKAPYWVEVVFVGTLPFGLNAASSDGDPRTHQMVPFAKESMSIFGVCIPFESSIGRRV
jgi:hypothetical protein